MSKLQGQQFGKNSIQRKKPKSSQLEEVFIYPPLPKRGKKGSGGSDSATRTLPSALRAEVLLEVPFIHQLWDTPNEFNGHWACGPTSMAMVLAHYGLLPEHPIEVKKPTPHTSRFGWYVSSPFKLNGASFEVLAGTQGNKMAAGLYGTALDNFGSATKTNWLTGPYRSPRGRGLEVITTALLAPTGRRMKVVDGPKRAGTRYLQPAPFENTVKATLDSGHPVIVSGWYDWNGDGKGYDHIIVIRGYTRDTSGKLGWIVNDPYGYQTDTSYDGQAAVYSTEEIHPKWMCLFTGFKATSAAPTTTRDLSPINATPLTLEGLQQIMPNAKSSRLAAFLPSLQAALVEFEISTPLRRPTSLASFALWKRFGGQPKPSLVTRAAAT
jgi:hypothetical protein